MLRRKLMINLLVIVICGTVALSIPVIVNYCHHSVSATDNNQTITLVCEFIGDRYQDQVDSCAVWQIYQKRGNKVVATWDEIYAANFPQSALSYDHEHLYLTPYGLCYRGIHTPADYSNLFDTNYHSYVTYQGQTCLLKVA